MSPVDTREIAPGISAVLAVERGQTGLDGIVLDLGAVLDGLVTNNFEILVVEYGSTERTPDLLSDMAARLPGLPLSVLPDAYPDQASALTAGFDVSSYDLLFVTATDGQFDVYELNHLLETIEHGVDLAIGYRVERADGLARRCEGWAWNVLVNLVFGKVGRDVDCGFKLFRRSVWERAPRRVSGVTFNAELLIRARRQGFLIGEVPVSHRRPRRALSTRRPARSRVRRAFVELNELRRALGKRQPRAMSAPAGAAAAARRAA